MIKDWCVVGRIKLAGGTDIDGIERKMVWSVQHYNDVKFYAEIYYDFNEDEAHAMCKLLNEGE